MVCISSFLPLTVPSYPVATWNQSYDLERDRVTGRVDVTYHLTLINHWKSLAILSSMTGHFYARTYDSSHIALERFSEKILVRVSVVEYSCFVCVEFAGLSVACAHVGLGRCRCSLFVQVSCLVRQSIIVHSNYQFSPHFLVHSPL